uniref:Uncharacterized protein n=1 Tax=Rhizophora mucronata TaxID=61149 RepID=A0A2P2QEK8_RHIMU
MVHEIMNILDWLQNGKIRALEENQMVKGEFWLGIILDVAHELFCTKWSC